MDTTAQDVHWMHLALELARRGIGLASPNPAVGCVIVDAEGGQIGEGWHEYDRFDHAEVSALKNARQNSKTDRLRGSTAFVTLEPCNHTGRTGPCTQALISAGVSRVVAATADPNPNVAGRGMEALRAAGIQTTLGVCESEARRINEGFAKWIQHRRPFVLLKAAMTLDGRIAPLPAIRTAREPYWITGEESRAAVQGLRASADAVLTGVGTILADDPLLTDRSGQARRRPLLRVVVDSSLRTPLDSKLIRSCRNDVMIFTVSTDESRANKFRDCGVRVEVLTSKTDRVPLRGVLERLGAEGILNVLLETGTRLNSAFLSEKLADRLQFFVSPQILGGDAIPVFGDSSGPTHLHHLEIERFGRDFAVSSLLFDPWPNL
jgi:diaminohydroxyphosphoribosylaminopyrimidine deaminase/5-amino-6-(5-phosphoribosylamino)uracil reductase